MATLTPSTPASLVRAEDQALSRPPTTAPEVIFLGLPEGSKGGEQRAQDEIAKGSSAQAGESLSASTIGAELTKDKSPVVL